MIDNEKLAQIKVSIAGKEDIKNPLIGINEADLRRLRSEINSLLPDDKVETLDLESELVAQYRKTKQLMDDVLSDEECPANQKAQVANSVVGTLGQLVKLQEELRREETLKLMESCLIESLKVLPADVRDAFFNEYERRAAKAGL